VVRVFTGGRRDDYFRLLQRGDSGECYKTNALYTRADLGS